MCRALETPCSRRAALRVAVGAAALTTTPFGSISYAQIPALPKEIIGVKIPDTQLAQDATRLMLAAAPPSLFNHCLRTFVLAMHTLDGRTEDLDVEMGYLASILHDLGLTESYPGDPYRTFEQNSGRFAAAFARAAGIGEARAERVYHAILLHAGKAPRDEPNVAFVMVGAAQDVFGPQPEQLSDEALGALERAVPRLGFRREFLEVLNAHVARSRNPDWTRDFAANPPPAFLDNRWPE